jgi:hypothetical protein
MPALARTSPAMAKEQSFKNACRKFHPPLEQIGVQR